jgi:hypothetical protein
MPNTSGSDPPKNLGQSLANWLNVRRHDPAREAARQLIGYLQNCKGTLPHETQEQIDALLSHCKYQYRVRRLDPAREAIRELIESLKKFKGALPRETEQQLNALLSHCQYQYSLLVGQMAHESVLAFRMDPVGEGSLGEHRVVTEIIRLYDQGLLARVFCCHGCGKWFFGRRVDQRFHALKCKQGSDEYREYQKKKQKEYYDRNNKK